MTDETTTSGIDSDYAGMSEKMKAKMIFIKGHFVKETIFGPRYSEGTQTWKTYNVWAFIFSFFYYFAKGMWRKAISLMLLNIVLVSLVFLGDLLTESNPSLGYNDICVLLITNVLASYNAYYDIYRSKVLKQKFWW